MQSEPKRILQVVTYMDMGGIESFLMNLYRSIDRNVVQFDFLMHREVPTYFDAEIESLGGRIHRLPPIRPDTFLRYRMALARFFREHPEYRIIHCHNNAYSMFVLREAEKHGVPVRIAHSHLAFPTLGLVKRITYDHCRARINRYTTHRFACSAAAGDWLYSGGEYKVFPNAIHTERFRYSEETRLRMRRELSLADALTVIHVGRFDQQKNHDFLIDAFAALVRKAPDALLLLVGDGVLRPRIEEKVRTLGLEGSVRFLGIRSDVPDLLQAADVFAFPSLYEGLPVTLIEAQASGIPCVISDTITSEVCVTDLAQALPIREPDLWADAILSGRGLPRRDTSGEIVRSGYDIHAAAQMLTNFYLNGGAL